jgi:hypothetical protein
MTASGKADPEFDVLRELLTGELSKDAMRQQAAFDARLLRLEYALQDETTQRDQLVRLLPSALEEARRTAPRKLSSSLAPLVVKSIHREIANSRDSMIEALHPIVGRLIGVSVANSLQALTAQINRRIEGALPIARLRLSVRAAIARKSVAELVMSELREGELTRIMVIERDTGIVLAAWEAPMAQHIEDPDLVAGMVSAITQFAGSLGNDAGELRTLSFQGRTLHIETSPVLLVLFQTNGNLPDESLAELQKAALDIAEAIGTNDDPQLELQAEQIAQLSGTGPDNRNNGRRWIMAAVVIAAVAVLVIPFMLQRIETRALERDIMTARQIAEEHPALTGLPVEIRSVDDILILGAIGRPGTSLAGLDEALTAQLSRRVRLAVDVPMDPSIIDEALDDAFAEIQRLSEELTLLRARLGTALPLE